MGIGEVFKEVGKIGKELLRAGAHGLSGGLQSAMSGGNFWHGFASGGISSGIGSGLYKASSAVQLLGSGLSRKLRLVNFMQAPFQKVELLQKSMKKQGQVNFKWSMSIPTIWAMLVSSMPT